MQPIVAVFFSPKFLKSRFYWPFNFHHNFVVVIKYHLTSSRGCEIRTVPIEPSHVTVLVSLTMAGCFPDSPHVIETWEIGIHFCDSHGKHKNTSLPFKVEKLISYLMKMNCHMYSLFHNCYEQRTVNWFIF